MTPQKLNKLSQFSHDVRSSLTFIKESISLINNGSLDKINAKQKRYLKIADKGIAKIVKLVDNFSKESSKNYL